MAVEHRRSTWPRWLIAAALASSALMAPQAQAITGPQAESGALSFTAKLEIGTGDAARACSGTLVAPDWVLTASSCFSSDFRNDFAIPTGKPSMKAMAVIGRADLTASGGHAAEVVNLVPYAGRDLVMAQLAAPAKGLAPVPVATTAPVSGETLKVAGYGRTKTSWVPDRIHTADFTLDMLSGSSLRTSGRTAEDSICKGDAGGPALRRNGDQYELVAVNNRAWQGGCLGETETRNSALANRVDDVQSWIQQVRLTSLVDHVSEVMTTGDFDEDGRLDVVAVLDDGSLHVFSGRPDGTLQYGRELWHDNGWGDIGKLIGGDFNGDGHADIAAISARGALVLYPGTGPGGKLGAGRPMWKDNTWSSARPVTRYKVDGSGRDGLALQADDGALYGYPSRPDGVLTGQRLNLWHDKTWNKRLIAAGDLNGDTYDDVIAVAADGKLHLYPGNARHTLGGARLLWHDSSWKGMRHVLAGDFDGDGKGDLLGRVGTGGLYWYAGDDAGTIAPGRLMWPTSVVKS